MKFGGRWGAGSPEDFEWRTADKQLHNATRLSMSSEKGKYQIIKQDNDTLKNRLFSLKGKILKRANKICWRAIDNNKVTFGLTFDIYQKKHLFKDQLLYKEVSISTALVQNEKSCVSLPKKGRFQNLYIANVKSTKLGAIPKDFIIQIFSQEY